MTRAAKDEMGTAHRARRASSGAVLVVVVGFALWTGRITALAAPAGHTCGDVAFIAAAGSGQQFVNDQDLSISPQLVAVYNAMLQELNGQRTVALRVLDYPALSVDTLIENLHGGPGQRLKQILEVNLPKYLAGERQGVTAMTVAFDAVRAACPAEAVVLAGYSQGAMVVHSFLDALAHAGNGADESAIGGVVLVADPERVKHTTLTELGDVNRESYGICDLVSFSEQASCTSPLPLADVPAVFQRAATDVCFKHDVVCDISDIVDDNLWNPFNWFAATNEGVTIHTDAYQADPRTRAAGTRTADLVLART